MSIDSCDEFDGGEQSGGGTTTLITLPARIDLAESGILDGIEDGEDVTNLNLLSILFDRSPDEWIQSVLRAFDETPAEVGVVNVGDTYRSTAVQSPGENQATRRGTNADVPPDLVTPVADPGDLPELGTAIDRYLDAWVDEDGRTVVVFDSVSGLLRAGDPTDGLRFLHALCRRITSTNSIGFFVVPPEFHDRETLSTLRLLFDEVVDYVALDAEATMQTGTDPFVDVLRDETRWVVVDLLTDDEPLSRGDLVDRLSGANTPGTRETLHVALYHVHLPKLANCGLIQYDPEVGMAELAIPVDSARRSLQIARERGFS